MSSATSCDFWVAGEVRDSRPHWGATAAVQGGRCVVDDCPTGTNHLHRICSAGVFCLAFGRREDTASCQRPAVFGLFGGHGCGEKQ